eukprot:scaffold26900_cov77-Skeletonema_marinoi.AAC.1
MSGEESNNNNNNQDGGGQSNKRKAEELTHQEKRQIKIEKTEHHNVQMFHHIVAAPEMDILQILNMQFSPGWVSNHSEIYSEERDKKREATAKNVKNGVKV